MSRNAGKYASIIFLIALWSVTVVAQQDESEIQRKAIALDAVEAILESEIEYAISFP
jgi:hypothetical protein